MSRYSHERNGTDMGEPGSKGSVKPAKGNGQGTPSFKSGSPLKGMPDDNNRDLPNFPGYNSSSNGKELNSRSVTKRGSI